MIFFFAVLLNEYDNYTNAQDFNAFFYFFLIATMMEKRSNLTAELKKLNWILDSLHVLKTI